MIKEKAFQWADALESGDYQQGKDSLITNDGKYCCLGVLCAINGLKTESHKFKSFPGDTYFLDGEGCSVSTYVPLTLVSKLKMQAENPYVRYEGEPRSLASLNDKGVPFTKIASLIREQYEAI
jgi:hypothetical protein